MSSRHVAALLEERGVPLAHATRPRGVVPDRPLRDAACHRRKRPGWGSGRLDEPARTVPGQGEDRSRAVEKPGPRRAVRLTDPRAEHAAPRGLPTALRRHGGPAQLPRDGSAATAAARPRAPAAQGTARACRPRTARHHLVEQEPRGVKRLPHPMDGGTALAAAQATRVGIERRPRLTNRPLGVEAGHEGRTAAAPCDPLACLIPPQTGATAPA